MQKVVITGAAGLLGQNLVTRLKVDPGITLVAIDKHAPNLAILRRLHPDIEVIAADLATPGPWQETLAGASAIVLCHAQIGGLAQDAFDRNNITATEHVLDAAKRAGIGYIVHISSSVVNSQARDFYTESKKAQEELVRRYGIPCVVLRPTLMFGWYDRKHLGWLRRFMQRVPVFPVPDNGRYFRQPLYVGDFANIIMACLTSRRTGAFDISGLERIAYIDLIKAIRDIVGARVFILPIPFRVFWGLLWLYGLFDRDPPFTTRQLEALVIPEEFPVIDWPGIFSVVQTPLRRALSETFLDPVHAGVVLDF